MSSATTEEAAAGEEKPESALSLARFVLILMLVAWAFRSFFVQPFNIPSGSMLPTLYIGDYLIVAKWPYGYGRYSFPFGFPPIQARILGGQPQRGDVVVFRHPAANADLIKRVIGLPGDVVAVTNGQLVLNGKLVPRKPLPPVQVPVTLNSPCRAVPPSLPAIRSSGGEPVCVYPAYLESLPGGPSYTVLDQVPHGFADDFGPVRVPGGRIFLMGDNRDDSLDSRYGTDQGGVGMLPIENLIGRATVTFWSTDGSASYLKPWTWLTALRGSRVGNGYTGAAE